MPKILGLKGIYSGLGFQKKDGRKLVSEDVGFIEAPNEFCWDARTGLVCERSPDDIVYDGQGLVVSPGWIDSHTHALFEGQRYSEFYQRWAGLSYSEMAARGGGIHNTVQSTQSKDEDLLIENLLQKLRAFVKNGTTFLEIKSGYANSAGGELYLLRTLKKARSQRKAPLPEFKTTFLGLHALPKGKAETIYVEEMIEALAVISKEGLCDFVDAFPEKGFFSLEQSLEYVRKASEFGLPAKVHADEITDMLATEYFTALGAISVDHLQKVNPRGIDMLASHPTVATLLPATSLYLGIDYAPARKLLDSGAKVALATDYNPGTAPELSFSLTQKLAASCLRMSPSEILAASTYNAACALKIEKERGLLLPGFIADFLLWKPSVKNSGNHGESFLEEIFLDSNCLVGVFAKGLKAFLDIR